MGPKYPDTERNMFARAIAYGTIAAVAFGAANPGDPRAKVATAIRDDMKAATPVVDMVDAHKEALKYAAKVEKKEAMKAKEAARMRKEKPKAMKEKMDKEALKYAAKVEKKKAMKAKPMKEKMDKEALKYAAKVEKKNAMKAKPMKEKMDKEALKYAAKVEKK